MATVPLLRPTTALGRVLRDVGRPRAAAFRPDPFQLEGLDLVRGADVLVCAPTGAGKTWIAMEAIDERLQRGERCWYASPLKALSNAKYEEFRERYGAAAVGILTGDRKENPDAPVVVGTTEIFRNQLYDAMERGEDLRVELVVVDEAHYLNDPERGVVWEEMLIYLPSRVGVLLLSATVGNPDEICRWLEAIRGRACRLVEEERRPVPLFPLFLHPDGRLGLLMDRHGLALPVRRRLSQSRGQGRRRGRFPKWPYDRLAVGLQRLDLLPAIFFLKSRSDCDQAVETCRGRMRPVRERERLAEALRGFLEEHPVLRTHRHISKLIEQRVASHHAGQLPQWKLLVENLMNTGYLDVIFATSTVAAGVDFPARAVALFQSDRFNGREFVELTATELQQMTGRAGRRGKDRVGFAVFVPGPHQDVVRIAQLLREKPEPIRSQIQTNFSMVLNLLLSHRPNEIQPLLERSLAAFQGWDHRGGSKPARKGDPDVEGAKRGSRRLQGDHKIRERLQPGRLFIDRQGLVHLAFFLSERRGKPVCMAHRLDRKVKARKGRLVLKSLPVGRIEALLEERVDLPALHDLGAVRRVIEDSRQRLLDDRSHLQAGVSPAAGRPAEEAAAGSWLWRDFLRHLRFLQETGFVDDRQRLTPDGRWASRLRLDHPLVVAEAIRLGVFQRRSAPVLAGLLAPFVTDREREIFVVGTQREEIADAFDALVAATLAIRRHLEAWGFDAPLLQYWPAAALYLWAGGLPWESLLIRIPIDEGDLVSLIVRTVDHLRQVCDLRETHPRVAATARQSIRLIQREPAVYA
jgi:ATP-dependent RNA helicase HelY